MIGGHKVISMRKILLSFVVVLALAGCGKSKPVSHEGEIAGKAAAQYYSYLQHGNIKAFVDGTYFSKPIPKSYRALLEKNATTFAGEQDSLHKGIKTVKVSRADVMKNDTTLAAVYLQLAFGDNTSEEVLVPMIKRKGVWYMK